MESLLRFATLLAVMVSSPLVSCQMGPPCIARLSSKRSLLFSFLRPSNQNEPPPDYIVNTLSHCIVYMDVNWNDDVLLKFATFRYRRSPSLSPVVQVLTMENGFISRQVTVNVTISGMARFKVLGNTSRSFAVVYRKEETPFVFTYVVKRARKLTCPDLESEFNSISCSNGSDVGSQCTYQCKTGSYPSPDLFGQNIASESLSKFQSSIEYNFFSTCSISETSRRPAWKPEPLTQHPSAFGVEWPDERTNWKCVNLQVIKDVCFVREQLFLKLTEVRFFAGTFGLQVLHYISDRDCNYPASYLLSIFNEERNGDLVTTTTTTTTTTTSTTPPPFVVVGPDGAEGFIIPAGRVQPEVAEANIEGFPSLDCTTYCALNSTAGSEFVNACGNYPTFQEQIDCLTCRYTGSGCSQQKAV